MQLTTKEKIFFYILRVLIVAITAGITSLIINLLMSK